jgi:replicative DNA helicase
MDMVQKFRREAEWRRTIMEGAEIISRDKHNGIGKIEEMFEKVLRSRPQQADDYLHGDDLNGLIEFLETRKEREFSLGIAPFDRRGVVPTRGELMVLLGISGAGKSWGLIQTGKCALMQGKKVLHVTLELSAQQVQQRMCQNFLALAKEEKDLSTPITRLRLNRQDELIGFGIDQSVAEFSLEDVKRVAKLRKAWGAGIGGRLKQLRIKQFPTGTLTLSQLRACLDQLETTGFVPDLLLLDYVGLMKTSADNKRIDLGRNVEGLRGLAMERNLALVTAQQINRDGVTSKIISRAHIAEDYSMICTADTVLILNRTLKEAQHKVARLWVDKARSTAQDFGAVITQNYEHGQFAIQASGFTGHDRVLEMVDQLPERAPAV